MNTEMRNIPNIVVDDNYRMLVNRLTRRYATRSAAVYTDADAIEQERSDARARAIAPEAYRISGTMGDNVEMYKSENGRGGRYMTTDDYLVYFSKCHDTFDAIHYDTDSRDETETEAKPRVLVNRRRLEEIKQGKEAAPRTSSRREKKEVKEEKNGIFTRMSTIRRRATAALAAVAASLAIMLGGVVAFAPSAQEVQAREIPVQYENVEMNEQGGNEVLCSQE